MAVEVLINNSTSPRARYVSWTPSPCVLRATGVNLGTVTLRTKTSATGGQLVFRTGTTGPWRASITLALPAAGASVPFFVAGRFGRPSLADGDAVLEVVRGAAVLNAVPLMVRVRKDANQLSPAERDRFVAAFAKLNNQGAGRFTDFRNMHRSDGSPEAHFDAGFLPWHRAYLLDLERELQLIDPSVTLPYWRFDKPAPKLFTRDFIGTSDSLGRVQFSATNPLQFWRTDGVPGIDRRPLFNTATQPANGVLTEAQTLALGSTYVAFRSLEGNPHGLAHTSFGGSISSIPTAARDPLFFLLHTNVDRLWAKWQRQNTRFDPALAASFDANPPAGNRIGHNLPNTMWPWNQITSPPRPPVAPGGNFAPSPCVPAPGAKPRVQDQLDYQGSVAAASRLGFDYDDVAFA